MSTWSALKWFIEELQHLPTTQARSHPKPHHTGPSTSLPTFIDTKWFKFPTAKYVHLQWFHTVPEKTEISQRFAIQAHRRFIIQLVGLTSTQPTAQSISVYKHHMPGVSKTLQAVSNVKTYIMCRDSANSSVLTVPRTVLTLILHQIVAGIKAELFCWTLTTWKDGQAVRFI